MRSSFEQIHARNRAKKCSKRFGAVLVKKISFFFLVWTWYDQIHIQKLHIQHFYPTVHIVFSNHWSHPNAGISKSSSCKSKSLTQNWDIGFGSGSVWYLNPISKSSFQDIHYNLVSLSITKCFSGVWGAAPPSKKWLPILIWHKSSQHFCFFRISCSQYCIRVVNFEHRKKQQPQQTFCPKIWIQQVCGGIIVYQSYSVELGHSLTY